MSSPAASEPWPVSAYIPCYNNAKTIGLAIQGIRNQTHPVEELFVIDDGSTDNSAAIAESLGIRVIRMGKNQGRGAVRARAMEEARNDFVLCGDATNQLAPTFLQAGMTYFSDARVGAVFGRCYDRNPHGVVDRWRARHLYKQDIPQTISTCGSFSTFGAIARKSAVMKVGNYDRRLRHGEDYELGNRLRAIGDVIADPNMEIQPVVHNTLFQVMERFARWNRAMITTYDLNAFIQSHIVAWKILIPRDLEQRDWTAALISASSPYFSFAYADKRSLCFASKASRKKSMPAQTKH